MTIARELETHAGEELAHALKVARHIDYLGGTPVVAPKPVVVTDDAEKMLRADLENESETIRHYRIRLKECVAAGEYAVAEDIREIPDRNKSTSSFSRRPRHRRRGGSRLTKRVHERRRREAGI